MANLSGSVQKRGKYSWLLTVNAPDSTGKRQRFTKTAKVEGDDLDKQEKQANHQLSLFIREVETGQNATSGKMTLHQFFDYWHEHYAASHHEDLTIQRNKELFERIDTVLGNIRLDRLEPKHLLEFYKNLAEPGIRKPSGRKKKATSDITQPTKDKTATDNGKAKKPIKNTISGNTQQKHHKLLSAMLNKAVQWKLIPYNPCAHVEAPKAEKTHIAILDEKQLAEFLSQLDGEELKFKVLCLLALSTGLRRGELFALQWQHINFDENTLRVEKSVQYLVGQGLSLKKPKTESSNRLIAVPVSVMELLKQHKAQQVARQLKLGSKWRPSLKQEEGTTPIDKEDERKTEHIFTTWNGEVMHPDSFNNWLAKFTTEKGLPHISPHAFRHMSATFALVQGISLKSVSSRLGHSKASTTSDIYSHALKSVDRDIADKMEDFITTKKLQKDTKKGQA
jgi:integrase